VLSEQPRGVRLVTLRNGLTLVIKQDDSAPVVSAQAWCETGSIHEGRWLGAGLSHILEHMLFKGTTTRGAGRIDQEVQEAGGQMNAYTSFDRTVYWINVPAPGAAVATDILADIMRNATLPEDELVKELDVIRREMDMNHDDPSRRSSRGLFETAYLRSPYRHTIIGYPDVQTMFAAFSEDEQAHILGLFDFIMNDARMPAALRKGDWKGFAYIYNGKGQATDYGGYTGEGVAAAKAMGIP